MFQNIRFLLQPPQPKVIQFTFAAAPNDDIALRIAGKMVIDKRRRSGSYGDKSWGYNGPMRVGDTVEVFTFDGWGDGWVSAPWVVQIIYANGETQVFRGGVNAGGDSIDDATEGDTAPFRSYYANGWFKIPPPPSWPCPNALVFGNIYSASGMSSAGTDEAPSTNTTIYWNEEQTAECPGPLEGTPVTIAAGTYSSTVSQAAANSLALAAARAALECCVDASLVFDSRFADKAKCGYMREDGENPPKYYRQKTTRDYAIGSRSGNYGTSATSVSCGDGGSYYTWSWSSSQDTTRVERYDAADPCSASPICVSASGSSSSSQTSVSGTDCYQTISVATSLVNGGTNPSGGGCLTTWSGTRSVSYGSGCGVDYSTSWSASAWTGTIGGCPATATTTPIDEHELTRDKVGESGSDTYGTWEFWTEETYADEFTTDDLKALAVAAMGSFPGTWTSGENYSAYNLNETEDAFTIRSTRGKFTVPAAVPDGWLISIDYKIEGPGGTTTGTCTISPGQTESPIIEIPVPAENGENVMTKVGQTCYQI